VARRIVVVGGVVAGMSAALAARRTDPDAEIIVLERGPWASYVGTVVPEKLGAPDGRVEDAVVVVPRELMNCHALDLRTQHEVVTIVPAEQRIEVTDVRFARSYELTYDALVLATGAIRDVPDVPGRDLAGAFALRTLEDGRAVQSFLQEHKPRTACIVGDGLYSISVVEALRKRGLAVTLAEPNARLAHQFHKLTSHAIQRELEHRGVRIELKTRLAGIERGEVGLIVDLAGTRLATDLVIFAADVRPNVSLATAAGVEMHACGGVFVDEYMHTSAPSVFAAGECTAVHHRLRRREVYLPLPSVARRQGEVAGANAAGARSRFRGALGAEAARIFDLEVARVGLTRTDIDDDALSVVEEVSSQSDRSVGEHGAHTITTILHAERHDGRLVAAEMFGRGTVARRIDVFAAALFGGMTLEEVTNLDLAYAPRAGPLTDPVVAAAEGALRRLEQENRELTRSRGEGDESAFDSSSP